MPDTPTAPEGAPDRSVAAYAVEARRYELLSTAAAHEAAAAALPRAWRRAARAARAAEVCRHLGWAAEWRRQAAALEVAS